jgi:ankyrin repeat protein
MVFAAPILVAFLVGGFLLFVKLRPGSASPSQPTAGDIRQDTDRKVSPAKYFSNPKVVSLIEAALNKDARAFERELARGAAINARGNDGLTPLHLALLNTNPAAFSMILEAGGDPNIAADNGDPVLSLAAQMPDSAYLAECLKHGARADTPDGRKETPLMIAATGSLRENVRILLEAGADPNARDARSLTPLMHAFQALRPDTEIARMLIRKGARPSDTNVAGLTARDYAETFGDAALLAVFEK